MPAAVAIVPAIAAYGVVGMIGVATLGIVGAIVVGALVGAIAGGITAAVTGEDIQAGVESGAMTGAIAGGTAAALGGADLMPAAEGVEGGSAATITGQPGDVGTPTTAQNTSTAIATGETPAAEAVQTTEQLSQQAGNAPTALEAPTATTAPPALETASVGTKTGGGLLSGMDGSDKAMLMAGAGQVFAGLGEGEAAEAEAEARQKELEASMPKLQPDVALTVNRTQVGKTPWDQQVGRTPQPGTQPPQGTQAPRVAATPTPQTQGANVTSPQVNLPTSQRGSQVPQGLLNRSA